MGLSIRRSNKVEKTNKEMIPTVDSIKNRETHSRIIGLGTKYGEYHCSCYILWGVDDALNRSNNNKDDTFGDGDRQEEAPLYIAKIKFS